MSMSRPMSRAISPSHAGGAGEGARTARLEPALPRPLPQAGGRRIHGSHSGLITVMDRAVRKAAPRLRRDFNEVQQLQVSRKGPADFVSMADKRAEETIFEELRQARPDWGFLVRRGRRDRGRPEQAALDRRSARRHDQLPPRHPAFRDLDRGRGSDGVGQARDHHGMVYQPLTDESFWAEKGRAPGCRTAACACRRAAIWPMR